MICSAKKDRSKCSNRRPHYMHAMSWLFRKCSVELATVTHLVNFSITLGQIQDVWLSAVVTPVYECPEICI